VLNWPHENGTHVHMLRMQLLKCQLTIPLNRKNDLTMEKGNSGQGEKESAQHFVALSRWLAEETDLFITQ
jgi:hypothetical protein